MQKNLPNQSAFRTDTYYNGYSSAPFTWPTHVAMQRVGGQRERELLIKEIFIGYRIIA